MASGRCSHSSQLKKRLDLPRLEQLAPETGLFSELERRSSFRNPGNTLITLEKPGRLLWASLRIKSKCQTYNRVNWKYEVLTYSLILKHMGVTMQQLYLVATALDLAPCSRGSGDSALFSRATIMNRFSDAAVCEFMISGR